MSVSGTFDLPRPGWVDQWRRLERSRAAMTDALRPSNHVAPGDSIALDAIAHFFMDAWHLKDWVINDAGSIVDRSTMDAALAGNNELSVCEDLANGIKHLKLTRKHRGNPNTRVARGAVSGPLEAMQVAFSIRLDDGTERDVATLADDVRAAWAEILTKLGLTLP